MKTWHHRKWTSLLRMPITAPMLLSAMLHLPAMSQASHPTPTPTAVATSSTEGGAWTPNWLGSLQGAPWADEAQLLQALRTRPAWLSAVSAQAAQTAQSQVTSAGSQAWSTELSMSRRHSQDAAQRRSNEWELAVQRPWRSTTQARAAEQLAQAQRDVAQQGLQRQWQDLTLNLVQDLADWLQAQAQTRAWQVQLDTVDRLAQAAARRAQAGEGTALERRQAEAAVLQARLQSALAAQRVDSQRVRLQTRWPMWTWLPTPSMSVQGGDVCDLGAASASATATATTNWAERLAERSTEVAAALATASEAAAQAMHDEALQTPEPTVGLKGGQAFSGAERYIGMTLSVPWGGPARHAQAQASAWRQLQAQQALDEARLNARFHAAEAVGQWQTACTQWQMETASLAIQEALAQSLARGHSLGEGSLQSVLLAQTGVQDMRLRAQAAQTLAWLAWSRLLIGAGELWPASSVLQPGLITSMP